MREPVAWSMKREEDSGDRDAEKGEEEMREQGFRAIAKSKKREE